MKITRVINGQEVEIELTADEMFNTYLEQEWLFDVRDIEDNMEYHLSGEEYEILKENRDFIESAAQELRRNQDKYDMDYEYALKEALTSTKGEYLISDGFNNARTNIYSLLDDIYDEMNVDSDNYKEAMRLTKDLCFHEFPDLYDCFFRNSDLDLFFTNPAGGFKLYYFNPDSNTGGQIVECQLEKEDLKEIMDGEDLMEVIAKYTQYLSDINTVHYFDTIFKLLDMKEQGLYMGTDINKLCFNYLSAKKEGSECLGEKMLTADEVKNGAWKIWFERFDEEGKKYGAGVMPQEYTHKSSAVRAAKRHMEKPGFKCVVSQENPFVKRPEDKKRSLDKRMLAANEIRKDDAYLSDKPVCKAGLHGQVR